MHEDIYEHDYTWTWRNEVKPYFSIAFYIVVTLLAGIGLGALLFMIYVLL